MANSQVVRVNKMLDDAGALLDFWSGSHLSRINGLTQDASRMGWRYISEPRFSLIGGYRKVEDAQKNDDMLYLTVVRTLSSAFAREANAVFFVAGDMDNTNVLISMGDGDDDIDSFKKTIPQISIKKALIRTQSAMNAKACYGGVITGFPDGAKLDTDYILDCMQGEQYCFSVVAIPVPSSTVQRLTEWIREIQSDYESIMPGSGRNGNIQNKMAKIATPEADELVEVLKDRRKALSPASAKELFSACIIYQSNDTAAAARLASAIQGAISSGKDNTGKLIHFPVQGMPGTKELFAVPELLLLSADHRTGSTLVGLPPVLANTETIAGMFALPKRYHAGFNVLETSIDSSSPNMFNPYFTGNVTKGVCLGKIDGSGTSFALPFEMLSRHTLLAATTGGGKTNVSFRIIEEVAKRGVSVLMIVPSMINYRELTPRLRDVRIYSRDSKETSLRLNIMEPEPGVIVADHIEELMICFKGAFGSEMEQAISVNLENLLAFTYEDLGIDINSLSDLYATWPTLSDARRLLPEYKKTMLYGGETGSDVSGALDARLANLTRGSAGIILNNTQNLCGADFCEGNVLIEEDELGLDTKPLVTGFVLACRVNKYLRKQKLGRTLRHLVVVEEAHQVFSRIHPEAKRDTPEAVASRYFEEMLSQLSGLGTGMLLVEQSPSRLGTSAIGNTNTKIIGKLDLQQDIDEVATALRLSAFQKKMLPFLHTGEMIVSVSGSPEICKVICDQVKE